MLHDQRSATRWFTLLDKAALVDALIPVTVALHLSKSTPNSTLIVCSVDRSETDQLYPASGQNSAPRETWLSWCVLLALVLLQARNIILRDDYRGPVMFLLISSGLLIGSQLTHRQWRVLLAWMGLAIAPLALYFAFQLSTTGDWSLRNLLQHLLPIRSAEHGQYQSSGHAFDFSDISGLVLLHIDYINMAKVNTYLSRN